MKITVGQDLIQEFVVQEQHTAAHVGSGALLVLATPMMIAFIENTALKLLGQSLEEGYSSVGIMVDIRHLAPSPLGNKIHVRVMVEQVEGEKVTLKAEVWDGKTLVGSGTHQRYLIEVPRFLERVRKLRRTEG